MCAVFRAPRESCALDANNDYDAVQNWLSLHESPSTQRAYRKEAERHYPRTKYHPREGPPARVFVAVALSEFSPVSHAWYAGIAEAAWVTRYCRKDAKRVTAVAIDRKIGHVNYVKLNGRDETERNCTSCW